MFNQKGQIHIIILVLVIAGFILYANFSGSNTISKWFESYKITPAKSKSAPLPAKKTQVSAPPAATPPAQITPAPVVPAEPDKTPPKRLNGLPKESVLPPETRKITLGLDTDEKAVCKYSEVAGVGYDAMQHFFDQASVTTHSTLITTLDEGGKYKYYIKCKDDSGNANTDDFIIYFDVKLPEDRTPPILTNPSHQGSVLFKDTKEAVISVSTNEPASCRYSSSAGKSYSSMSGSLSYFDQTKKFHVKTITGLQNGQNYDFFVRCQDLAGNANTGDVLIWFSVEP